jgi:ABC-type transport system involved in multi-copper enzyme maturation permease subunit
MNTTVFLHSLKAGRMGFAWYTLGTFLVIAVGGLGLSSIQSNGAAFQDVLKGLPPALLEVFQINLSSFTSTVGFISARSLSLLYPLLILAFVTGSASSISQMIERGTIHFELSLPISRTQWFLSQAMAGFLRLLCLVAVTWICLTIFAAALWWRFAVLALAFGVLWFGMAYAVTAFVRERNAVNGLVFGLFGTQFMLATLSSVVDGLAWLEGWNVWSAYRPEAVINQGVPWQTVVLWLVMGLALLSLGTWRWHNRDLPA